MLNTVQHFDKSSFEALRQTDEHGNEFWSARNLQSPAGYEKWENFETAIERARTSCANIKEDPNYHFPEVRKMIKTGKGAQREIIDYHLSRFGASLTFMNGDPNKPEIAAAQAYFYVKTRQAESLNFKDLFGIIGIAHKIVSVLTTSEVLHSAYKTKLAHAAVDKLCKIFFNARRDLEGILVLLHKENRFEVRHDKGLVQMKLTEE